MSDESDLREIEQYRQRYGRSGMTAGEFAELLPDHLRGTYWRIKIDELFQQEDGKQDR